MYDIIYILDINLDCTFNKKYNQPSSITITFAPSSKGNVFICAIFVYKIQYVFICKKLKWQNY